LCSTNVKEILGKASDQASVGFAVADIGRSSLILCGKAFAASGVIKDALCALAAPVLSARGGIPLCARYFLLCSNILSSGLKLLYAFWQSFPSLFPNILSSGLKLLYAFWQSFPSLFPNILSSGLKLLAYSMLVQRVNNLDPRASFKLISFTESSIF
jgi:hypothetical protein